MTLYLVGKAKDAPSWLIVSDSQGTNSETGEAVKGDFFKVFYKESLPGIVLCGSGSSSVYHFFVKELQDNASSYSGNIGNIHDYVASHKPGLDDLVSKIGLTQDVGRVKVFTISSLDSRVSEIEVSSDHPQGLLIRDGQPIDQFPFYTGGMNDLANEALAEILFREADGELGQKDLFGLFRWIMQESEKREDEIGGRKRFTLVEEKSGIATTLSGRYQQDHELPSNVSDVLARSLKEMTIEQDLGLASYVVECLDDLDVLRRLNKIYLARSTTHKAKRHYREVLVGQSLFFLEAYLKLIPSAGKEHRIRARPIQIEPYGFSKDYYQMVVERLRTKQDKYSNQYFGRAQLVLYGLTRGEEQLTAALTSLAQAFEEEETVITRSWYARALHHAGSHQEAREHYQLVIDEVKSLDRVSYPHHLASQRSLKGMIELGHREYSLTFLRRARKELSIRNQL